MNKTKQFLQSFGAVIGLFLLQLLFGLFVTSPQRRLFLLKAHNSKLAALYSSALYGLSTSIPQPISGRTSIQTLTGF